VRSFHANPSTLNLGGEGETYQGESPPIP
jgi:hypothetical protein